MNFPTDIPGLEAELNRVLGMCEQDEQTLAHSTMPEVDKIFLSSTEKLRSHLEQLLNHAKSERAHETINSRIEAPQLIQELRLCDEGVFEVEKTVYPISASSKKRNVYRLISLDAKAKGAAHNEE